MRAAKDVIESLVADALDDAYAFHEVPAGKLAEDLIAALSDAGYDIVKRPVGPH